VFGDEAGGRVGRITTAWNATCRRAGIEGLHFHDLRHEFISRLLEAGVATHKVRDWVFRASFHTHRESRRLARSFESAVQCLGDIKTTSLGQLVRRSSATTQTEIATCATAFLNAVISRLLHPGKAVCGHTSHHRAGQYVPKNKIITGGKGTCSADDEDSR
jgi:hypothetical protein